MIPNRYRPITSLGLGGVAIGNGFRPMSDEQAEATLNAAWQEGVRYFDTSPFYGYGLSEVRFGRFLRDKPRDSYTLSTKVGRVFRPGTPPPHPLWKDPLPNVYDYDYTAAGVRRSLEQSLERMGVDRFDIVFIHDLSPDNAELGETWRDDFEVALAGAMPALTAMRDSGVIKAWGLGVNRAEPALRALDDADPDIMLLATQYSLLDHDEACARTLPAMHARGVSVVIGAPLNAGYLADHERFNYGGTVPRTMSEKRALIESLAVQHGTDLRTASLQFAGAPTVVSAVLPGASTPEQVRQNAASMRAPIPKEFWDELRREGLIAPKAAVPR